MNNIIVPPVVNDDFRNDQVKSDLVISDEDYASLSEATNSEQVAKLRCWDVQEYINSVEAQKQQLDTALENAQSQLEEAKSKLTQSRVELKSTFDAIFGPLGLENKMVSVSQTHPHVVTIVDPSSVVNSNTQ